MNLDLSHTEILLLEEALLVFEDVVLKDIKFRGIMFGLIEDMHLKLDATRSLYNG